jgi:hypothetical protein
MTSTFQDPAVFPVIWNEHAMEVALPTLQDPGILVSPLFVRFTTAPVEKPVPVIWTFEIKLVLYPLLGEMLDTVGEVVPVPVAVKVVDRDPADA